MPGHQVVDIAERCYDAADEFAVAHEIVELHIPKLGALHEDFVDRAAAALLMPRTEFLASVAQCLFDVAAVRRQWHWASFTAIIWRIAELCPNVAAARWHKGELLERRCNRMSLDVTAAEKSAVAATGKGMCFEQGVLALAWHLSGRGERGYSVTLAMRPMR